MNSYREVVKHIKQTFKEYKVREVIKMIVSSHTSPHEIALGASIGVFFSIIPTFSLGMFTALFIAWKRNLNLLATYFGTLVVNPINSAPVYFFHYKIGSYLVGGDKIDFVFPIPFQLLKQIALQVYIGGTIVSILVTIVTYLFLYVAVALYRKGKDI